MSAFEAKLVRPVLGVLVTVAVCGGLMGLSHAASAAAQRQQAAGQQTAGSVQAARSGTVGGRPAAVPDDNEGFQPIFDGRTLSGWDGEPGFWLVEDGAIVGETTHEKPLPQNTFIVWRGGATKDFELKVEYRIKGGNSGVNYRSSIVGEVGKWVMRGYQANMDGQDNFTGEVYEERARGLLALRGQATRVAEDGRTRLIGSLGGADELKALIKAGDWNQMHVVARGSTILQFVNGRLMSAVVDEDPKGRALDGLLGMQLHAGPPMRVEFRNILLKRL